MRYYPNFDSVRPNKGKNSVNMVLNPDKETSPVMIPAYKLDLKPNYIK